MLLFLTLYSIIINKSKIGMIFKCTGKNRIVVIYAQYIRDLEMITFRGIKRGGNI